MQIFIQFLFYNIIVIIAFYFIGSYIFLFFKKNARNYYCSFFLKLFLGLFATVTSYSILKSFGLTINIGLFLIFIYLAILNKNKGTIPSFKEIIISLNYEKKIFIFFSGIFLGFFCWQFWAIFLTESPIPTIINHDTLFNANIATYLKNTGNESLVWNYISNKHETNPYHYFESWFAAMLINIFQQNSWIVMQVIVIPILQSIVVAGIWMLISNNKPNKITLLLSSGIVYMSGIVFNFFEKIPFLKYSSSYSANAINEPWVLKMLIGYILVIPLIWFIRNKKYIYTFSILAAISIVSINLAPFAIIVSGFLLGMSLFFPKIVPEINWRIYIITFFSVIFIVFFYLLTGHKSSLSISMYFQQFPEINSELIKMYTIISIEKVIYFIILYFPFTLIIIINTSTKFYIKNIFTPIKLLFIITFAQGIFLWLIFYGQFGASEFLHYPILCISHILIYYKLLLVINNTERTPRLIFSKFLFLFLFFIIIYQSFNKYVEEKNKHEKAYNNVFIEEAKEYLCSQELIGGKLMEEYEIEGVFYNSFIDKYGIYLNYFASSYMSLISLNHTYELYDSTKPYSFQRSFIESSIFYNFDKNYRKTKYTKPQRQLLFLVKNRIKFVVVGKNTEIPSEWKININKVIIDNISNEKIVFLKIND